MQSDRLPPQSAEAEAATLGSMLLDNIVIGDVTSVLGADDFYLPDNRDVFKAIVRLSDAGQPVDLLLLSDTLRAAGELERVGGTAFLVSLIESVPSAHNAEYYAKLVGDASLRRKLLTACTEIGRVAHDGTVEPDELLDAAQAAIFAVSAGDKLGDVSSVADLLHDVFAEIRDATADQITGLRTYFAGLDDITCGLQAGELIVIASRPSMGKTTLALNIAGRVALGGWHPPAPDDAVPVVVFSMEMGKGSIARNVLCSYAGADAHKLRRGMVAADEIEALTDKVADLATAPLYIDDTAGLSLRDLRTRARRLKMKVPTLGLVIIDYMQLMDYRGAENRQQEISAISRGLKGLARELGVPVIALSQLSRQPEARDGGVPRLSDLRESGSIEQDADVVILLYREEQYRPGARENEADLIVAKQRNGPTGTVVLTFLRQLLRFEDYHGGEPPY